MNDLIEWKEYKKQIDSINYECTFNEMGVICSEYGDDPHGINNEVRCTLQEFIDKSCENALRCHSFIKTYYGDKKLLDFKYFVQKFNTLIELKRNE